MINPIANIADTSQTTQSSGSNELQDQFLTMLMAQIQFQDPLNPMETAEFTSQLAQLSTVEQLQEVNKNLSYEQLYLASINNSQALGFIGKEVSASGNSIYWDGETSPDLNYILSSNATTVVANIFDGNGSLVRTIHMGEQNKGRHEAGWDGANSSGEPVASGEYTFKVMATDVDGNTVDVTTMLAGTVEGIAFENGVTYVSVRGQKIPIGDIIEINRVEEPLADDDEEEDSIAEKIIDGFSGIGRAAVKAAPFLM